MPNQQRTKNGVKLTIYLSQQRNAAVAGVAKNKRQRRHGVATYQAGICLPSASAATSG